MSSQEKEYKCIISYLKSLDFHFHTTWVIQCINYCKSKTPNISLELLKKTLEQQWLLLNLRDLKIPILPPNLMSCEKTTIHGRYVVQVESMIDCSKSYYSQLLNLRKMNVENIQEAKEVNIKSDRCLIFIISDGVQELKAMEYRIIKKIKVNDPTLLPGFKMVIVGPIECRKGMLLLKDENIRLCGGEIDTLVTTNNLQSLLIKKLDISEEDLPSNNFKEQCNNQNVFNQIQSLKSKSCENENIEALLSENDDVFFSLPTDFENFNMLKNESANNDHNKNISTLKKNIEKQSDCISVKDNNIFCNTNKTLKKRSLPIEEKISPNSKKFSLRTNVDTFSNIVNCQYIQTQNLAKASKIEEMSVDDDVIIIDNFSQHLKKKSISEFVKEPVQTKLHSFFKGNLANTCEINKEKNEIINTKFKKSVVIDNNPFVYLKDIKSVTLKTPFVFQVKCVVLTLKEKISIENDKFNLKGIITDGSDSIYAIFSSSIIESFLDYSPCEMESMLKNRLINNAVNGQIKEAFKKAQEKFINLNCLMKIKFFPDETIPVILSLEELTLKHLNSLRERTLMI